MLTLLVVVVQHNITFFLAPIIDLVSAKTVTINLHPSFAPEKKHHFQKGEYVYVYLQACVFVRGLRQGEHWLLTLPLHNCLPSLIRVH